MKTFWRNGFLGAVGAVVLASTLAYLGIIPAPLFSPSHADWVGHALGFGTVAFFLDGVLGHKALGTRGGLSWARIAPALVLLVAGTDEILQRLSSRRSSNIGDFLADVVGVSIGTWLAVRVGRYVARVMESRERALSTKRG